MTSSNPRRRFIRAAAATAAGAATLAAPAIVRAQPKIRWRCQTMWSPAELTHKAFEDFCQRVAVATNGRLEIQPFAAGSVTGVFETLDAVSAGVLDAHSSAPVYWTGKDPGFAMIGDLNFGYEHPWQAEAWFHHRGGLDMLREAYARFNVYPVGVSWWGVEKLVSKRPLKTMADFKGMKVRTPQGMFADIISKLGASVVVVPGGEVYSALDKGVVDAADWATESMNHRMGFFEIAKHSVGLDHSMPAQEFAVNMRQWNALSPDLKQILSSMVREWSWDQVQRIAVADAGVMADMRAKGVTLYEWDESQMAKIRQLARDTWEDWAKKSPLAKRAYDSQTTWLKELGVLS
jgi:TRAP-type mannitol/chloroaromatic compound transport system substrate-binding protein